MHARKFSYLLGSASVIAMLAAIALPGSALAQGNDNKPSTRSIGEEYHVELSGGFWRPSVSGIFSSEQFGITGTDINFKSDLGFKLGQAYKTTYGLLKPTVQLLWRHEYSDTRLQSVANFAADTSGATSFVTQGAKPVKDTGVLSLGATLLRSDKLTLSANYTLEQGGGYTSQTGSLLARWRF